MGIVLLFEFLLVQIDLEIVDSTGKLSQHCVSPLEARLAPCELECSHFTLQLPPGFSLPFEGFLVASIRLLRVSKPEQGVILAI